MNNLINKWAVILHRQDLRETKTNKIATPFEEHLQYKQFLNDCRNSGIEDKNAAEEIWFLANKKANELY